jgi:Membrane bound O-acyl transferase family
MWPDNLNWQMTVSFLTALAVLGFAMKLAALLLPARGLIPRRSISWILVSPDSVLRSQPVTSVRPVLLKSFTLLGALLLGYWVYWQIIRGFHIQGILVSYLAVPILVLMGEFLVSIMTLILLPGGWLLPALHRGPWAAQSIADFWARRWNLWFSDWFRYSITSRLPRHPIFALFLAFAISGLAHEWVINLPLYYFTGRFLFGTMMVYFLLQAAGILWEHYFLKNHPRLMAVFVWLVVFVPSPLVLNEGWLRVFHLWPGNDAL